MSTNNRLLDMLPDSDLNRILPTMEDVWLFAGAVVHESGQKIREMYFPTGAVFSIIHETEEGAGTEVALVAREGATGIYIALGLEASPSKTVVHTEGNAKRLSIAALKRECLAGNALLPILLRYTSAFIGHMATTAVCNRHHSVEEQLCRYLLLSADRANSNVLALTQEIIGYRLGIRREGVSKVAMKLQREGHIQHSRGKITVVNREALEQCACECYDVINQQYEWLAEIEPIGRHGHG